MRSMAHLGLKKISIHSILLATATAAALTLAGCGGGDSAATGGSGSTVTGQFVDATVVGLGYKCGTSSTLSGNTDANGQFTCKSGEAVAFYVGASSWARYLLPKPWSHRLTWSAQAPHRATPRSTI